MTSNKTTLALACCVATLAFAVSPSVLATGLSAPAGSPSSTSSVAGTASAASKNKILLAAAEPFENLTEMAFSSNWSKIDHTISEAKRMASGARASLPQDAVGNMDSHLAAMTAARQKKDRADLALSSIEVYRVLVSSVSGSTKIPVQVSLLDYSGFRYDADLKSSPVRWDDMAKVMTFAHQQWAVISPRLKGVPVAKRFEKSLDGMDTAVQQKKHSLAASSVRSESDLVDELENHFSSH